MGERGERGALENVPERICRPAQRLSLVFNTVDNSYSVECSPFLDSCFDFALTASRSSLDIDSGREELKVSSVSLSMSSDKLFTFSEDLL